MASYQEDDEFEQEFIEFCNGVPCVYLFAFVIVGCIVMAGLMSSSIGLAMIVVLCLVPIFLVMYMMYLRNHMDAVPPTAVIHSYCWGAISAFPVLSVQILSVAYFTGAWDLLGEPHEDNDYTLDDGPNVMKAVVFSIYQACLVCTVTENVMKYFIVTQFPGSHMAHRPYGVVVLCLGGAMGFATLENLGYVLFDDDNVGYFVALMRAMMDICLHAITAALIGVRVALKDHETYPFLHVMAVPFAIHGLYDLFLVLASRLGTHYPTLNLLPIFSVLVVGFSFNYTVKQVAKVSEYEVVGDGARGPDPENQNF